jgi:hypothetical protein
MASTIPGGGGKVKLNSAGMRELMKSNEVRANLVVRMSKVQSALPGSKMEVSESPTRVRVKVIRGSNFDEANTGDLSRALDLAGGKRGTRVKTPKPTRRRSG